MNDKLLKYLGQAIVRHLDGDIDKFTEYRDMAMEIYRKEYSLLLEDLIPEATKIKLYEMVS